MKRLAANRIFALLLTFVMLIGIIPYAGAVNVSAAIPEESEETGIVQGENDAVVFHTGSTNFGYYDDRFAGNMVNGTGNAEGKAFDRIIVVFTKARTMGSASIDFTGETNNWAGGEKLVFTSKVYVTNLAYTWEINGSGSSAVKNNGTFVTQANKSYDYTNAGKLYLGQKITSYTDDKKITLGCNLTFDFIHIDLSTNSPTNPHIDCNGYSLKIGKHVNFTYDSDATDLSKFTIINSRFNSDAASVQTIEILTGDYQAILPYPCVADSTATLNGTLNVIIGSGLVNGEPSVNVVGSQLDTVPAFYTRFAVLANTDMAATTTVNYKLDGVSLAKNFYLFYGRRLSAAGAGTAPVAAGVVNLTVKDSTMPLFGSALSSGATLPNYVPKQDELGFTLNATLINVKKADGSALDINVDGFSSDFFTSNVYADLGESTVSGYDTLSSVPKETCSHLANTEGSTLEYNTVNGVPTVTCSVDGCSFKREYRTDANGKAVIYLDSLKGSDTALGDRLGNAAQSFDNAFSILSEFAGGGTVVLVDGFNNRNYGNGTEMPSNAGGRVTITSDTTAILPSGQGVNYRETSGACYMVYRNLWLYNSVAFDNMVFSIRTNEAAIYLNNRSFTVNESCEAYRYGGSAAATGRIGLNTDADVPSTLSVVSGFAPSAIEDNGDANINGRNSIGSQVIDLQAGAFKNVQIGNRTGTSLETEADRAAYGSCYVNVGAGADIAVINAITQYSDIEPYFCFGEGVEYEIFTDGESIAASGMTVYLGNEIVHTETEPGSGIYTASDSGISYNNEKHVAVINTSLFTEADPKFAVKLYDGAVPAVRVTSQIASNCDENGIVGFGFMFASSENASKIRYISEFHEDNLGRSVAYDGEGDKPVNYYSYAAGDELASFSGILKYDQTLQMSYGDADFVARPYAVYSEEGTRVTYFGAEETVNLQKLCLDLIDAGGEDAVLAQKVINLIIGTPPATPDIDDAEKTDTFDENNVVLSFGAISDVHISVHTQENKQKYPKALESLLDISGGDIDALVIAGDIIHNLSSGDNTANSEMRTFASITKEYTADTSIGTNVLISTGNHDTRSYNSSQSAMLETYFGEEYYLSDFETNAAKGYRHSIVNGYHFLILDAISRSGMAYGEFDDTVLEWVDKKLEQITSQSPDKYVFIITHAGVTDTTYGTEDEYEQGSERWRSSTLAPILEKYPQVMVFSGHTHTPIFDERSIMQDSFTSVNCGAVANTSLELDVYYNHVNDENPVLDNTYISTGHYVQVDASGNVRITRILFPCYDETVEINQEYQTIKSPWELTYPKADDSHLNSYRRDLREAANAAPIFEGELAAEYTGNAYDVTLTVPAATDDDFVHHYRITVTNSENGETISEYLMLSDFICRAQVEDMLDTLEFRVPLAKVNCLITVAAVDSWGAESGTLTVTADLSTVEE